MSGYKDLIVYKKAFSQAMDIFEITKSFPVEERYSLTDQIRRSSRSVCSNIAEGYRKRMYEAHFVSKMSDADMENSETLTWVDFALACKYIDKTQYNKLIENSEEVGRLISHMIRFPEKYRGSLTKKK